MALKIRIEEEFLRDVEWHVAMCDDAKRKQQVLERECLVKELEKDTGVFEGFELERNRSGSVGYGSRDDWRRWE